LNLVDEFERARQRLLVLLQQQDQCDKLPEILWRDRARKRALIRVLYREIQAQFIELELIALRRELSEGKIGSVDFHRQWVDAVHRMQTVNENYAIDRLSGKLNGQD
jgi:hypothetical protein